MWMAAARCGQCVDNIMGAAEPSPGDEEEGRVACVKEPKGGAHRMVWKNPRPTDWHWGS